MVLLVLLSARFRQRKLLYLVMAGRLRLMVRCIEVCTGWPLSSGFVHSLGQLFGRHSLLSLGGRVVLRRGSNGISLVLVVARVLSALVQVK